MSTIQPIDLLSRLVAFGSVSSVSNSDVSDWVSEHLESLGFRVEQTSYVDTNGETKVNVVGCREPQSSPRLESDASGGLAYFCHTDVVPPGDWVGPGGNPYDAVIQDHRIFARGACDMKGSLAAMLCAAASVQTELQSSPLWIVCTADEEIGFRGARHLIDHSEAYREIVAAQPMSIIGEPTMLNVVHAHKGIYGYRFTSRGKAAHSSTEDGVNANIAMVPMLQTLLELGEKTKTDPRYHDGRFDPPTLSWNFGISEGGTAINVTAEQSVSWLSLRPMPQIDGKDLIEQVAARAKSLGLQMETLHGGDPLWVDPASECVRRLCVLAGGTPQTVCFGTDGGEFAELKHRVVWGPGSIAQAHTADEWLDLNQLSRGIELFTQALRQWCC